jgi:hypothetical protein
MKIILALALIASQPAYAGLSCRPIPEGWPTITILKSPHRGDLSPHDMVGLSSVFKVTREVGKYLEGDLLYPGEEPVHHVFTPKKGWDCRHSWNGL